MFVLYTELRNSCLIKIQLNVTKGVVAVIKRLKKKTLARPFEQFLLDAIQKYANVRRQSEIALRTHW